MDEKVAGLSVPALKRPPFTYESLLTDRVTLFVLSWRARLSLLGNRNILRTAVFQHSGETRGSTGEIFTFSCELVESG